MILSPQEDFWNEFLPLPALLVFSPMTILIGIISQLLWQEKPVIGSVWLHEGR